MDTHSRTLDFTRHATAARPADPLPLRHERLDVAERERVACELHDAVSQTLFAVNLLAGTLARTEELDDVTRGQVQTLERLNRSALAEMRMMLFELRPDALAGVRLPELLQHAVDALAGRGGVNVTTAISSEPGPPTAQRGAVYRVAQEALSNIGRHSGASNVHVGWTIASPGSGHLRIVDDGCGFDTTAPHPGRVGLDKMRRRAAAAGAELSIVSRPRSGTELNLQVNWN